MKEIVVVRLAIDAKTGTIIPRRAFSGEGRAR
jgi:hypothetical protein